MSHPHRLSPVLLLCLLLGACSEPAKVEKAKGPEKPPQALTGRQAFQRIYPQARGWSPDAQPLLLRSIHLSQVKSEKGTAGAWEAILVSVSKGKSRTYTYSAIEAEGNLHEGVFAGLEESYSGPRGAGFPFSIAAIKTDSDQAYDIAAAKSQDYIKKHPDMPISYVLEQTSRFPDLAWRVIWGESASSSDYSVFVDATLGKYLEKAH
ncbi:MAG: hypothetical protein LAP38_02040 [Acidobacteriia bacterium]|nr:hypothetical protein [Terriglobia bacterium]